ncbi:MAG: MFS transporter, partial [Actinomycetia bacterium]|nr:MFS transporter [Actinomycetes bacterium]
MLQIPLRLALLLRPSVGPSILLAVGFSTFVMASTPFLVDLVVDEYGIGLALASLIGVAQLGGFVIGSWGSGRWLSPRRRVFVGAMFLAVATNLVSSLLPPFAVLVGLRFGSGLALGLITWFAWVQVFGQEREMGDLA